MMKREMAYSSMYSQNVRPAKRRPRCSVGEQDEQDQRLGPGLVELRRMERDVQRRPDVGGRKGIGEGDRPTAAVVGLP